MNEIEKLVKESRAPKEFAEAMKTEEKKSRAVSLRIEEPLFRAIEAQAELWNVKPAETIRRVLRFYFLPVALEMQLRGESEKFWKGELTPEALREYMVFTLEATGKLSSSALFLKGEASRLSEALEGKLSEALKEEREGAEP
jgi:predicted DNA binding CopG/RHH family protein